MNDSNKSIYICGSSGMVGSALVKYFKSQTSLKVISSNRDKLDLMKKESVDNFFKETQIDFMIIAAAKVGGNRVHGVHDLGRKIIVSLH